MAARARSKSSMDLAGGRRVQLYTDLRSRSGAHIVYPPVGERVTDANHARTTFSSDSRADQRARSRAARARAADDRPPRAGVREADPRGPRRASARRDDEIAG